MSVIGIICVGLGGAVGAVMRYLMGFLPYVGTFPLITFVVNFLGAVLIGAVAELAGQTKLSSEATLFLKTGLCGGFTTFSTFSLETLQLFESGEWLIGSAYALGSVIVCVAGVIAGRAIVRAITA